MILVRFNDGGVEEIHFTKTQGYKTWYWHNETGKLIVQRTCHQGCRVEIPAENIRFIEVTVKGHDSED